MHRVAGWEAVDRLRVWIGFIFPRAVVLRAGERTAKPVEQPGKGQANRDGREAGTVKEKRSTNEEMGKGKKDISDA